MVKGKSSPRNEVVLTAFDDDEKAIDEVRLVVDEYYDESTSLIDSSRYRRQKNIRCIKGKIYDSRGRLSQTFENYYNEQGGLVRSRTVHEDGSVTEHVLE